MHFLRPDPVRCREDRAKERQEELVKHIIHAIETLSNDLMEIRFLSLAHRDSIFNLLIDHRAA